ncbi:MAG: flagellar basal body rod protein FlgB [Phycisphaerales bacterium]
MFSDLGNSGAAPALESLLRFAAQRQRIIASNIANIATPGYVMRDVNVADFQQSLRDAVERRRDRSGGASGPLEIESTREVQQDGDNLFLRPSPLRTGILFHDRNNRDVERLMQAQIENATVFRVAADLLKSRHDLLRASIAERVG